MTDRTFKRIAVIGNYSGRNAGDAALLEGLMRDVTTAFPDQRLRFVIPTIKPSFVRDTYGGEFDVRPVGLLPWNLSLKILGVPIVKTVLSADLVLVTDAILFDRKLYNPTFNYLHTLSWVLPLAARRGVPVVLYGVSLGSLSSDAGRRALIRVLRASKTIVARDRDSVALAAELVGAEALLGADCALSAIPTDPEGIEVLCRDLGILQSGRPVLAFNLNAYVDAYVRDRGTGIQTARFQRIVAACVDRAISQLDANVLFVQTQVMDLPMARGVIERVARRDRVEMISNRDVSHSDIAGVLARVDAIVAMRTHAIILASSAHTPVCGLIVYPKTQGYLDQIDCGEMRVLFDGLSEQSLWERIEALWSGRDELRQRLARSVERERERGRGMTAQLAPWLG